MIPDTGCNSVVLGVRDAGLQWNSGALILRLTAFAGLNVIFFVCASFFGGLVFVLGFGVFGAAVYFGGSQALWFRIHAEALDSTRNHPETETLKDLRSPSARQL